MHSGICLRHSRMQLCSARYATRSFLVLSRGSCIALRMDSSVLRNFFSRSLRMRSSVFRRRLLKPSSRSRCSC